MKTIKLKQFGERLLLRKQAGKIKAIANSNNYKVVFDFQGIKSISSSFADEVFAKGFNSFGFVFKIRNLNNDAMKDVIKIVISNRKTVV